jgi:poly-gamma-glutamate synthesis protein (capsule biosynthesis protein)
MIENKTYNLILRVLFLIIFGLTTACEPNVATNTPSTPKAQTPSVEVVKPTSTHTSKPTLTQAPSATQEPLALFLPEPLPDGMISGDIPNTYKKSFHSNTLWFGTEIQAPQGEILHTTNWVYALAAPFPTILDDLSTEDFQDLWFGGWNYKNFLSSTNLRIHLTSDEEFQQLRSDLLEILPFKKLYVPETIIGVMEALWGYPDGYLVKIVETIPDPEVLWEENAWALVPFEDLNPKLKVISINGTSPLFKDFQAEDYPFNLEYQVIKDQHSSASVNTQELQDILSGIEPTNRDPDKMTTLVMTGVTALVRATAYRMEQNGVTYPGEEIAHWLREADITHISNEVSFYEDCPSPDPNNRMLYFCSDPKYIELFEFVGADIIELTGNHNNDSLEVYGEDVVPFTLDLYEKYGMETYGGGLNLEDSKSPTILTHNGNNIAFIGCNAPGPDYAWATETRGGAAPCGDYQWMIDEINQLRLEGILPIATLQYYEDYYNYPETHHIRDFIPLAEAGAAVVNGSQAHLAKGMTFQEDTFIDFGLGNLFFDQMGVTVNGENITQTRWEVIQRHTIYNGQLLSTELLTAILEDYAQPRPMTAVERIIFLEELFTASGWISR